MDAHILELEQAQDSVYLEVDFGNMPSGTDATIRYMSFVIAQMSTDMMKDKLFGMVVDRRFSNLQLSGVIGIILSLVWQPVVSFVEKEESKLF